MSDQPLSMVPYEFTWLERGGLQCYLRKGDWETVRVLLALFLISCCCCGTTVSNAKQIRRFAEIGVPLNHPFSTIYFWYLHWGKPPYGMGQTFKAQAFIWLLRRTCWPRGPKIHLRAWSGHALLSCTQSRFSIPQAHPPVHPQGSFHWNHWLLFLLRVIGCTEWLISLHLSMEEGACRSYFL